MIKKLRNTIQRDGNLKELLRGSSITLLLKIAGMLMAYVVILLLSKKAGAEGVGFYQLFIQIMTVASMILVGGMNTGVLRYAGQFNNPTDRSKMHVLYKFFVRSILPVSIVFSIILFLTANYWTHFFGKGTYFTYALQILAIGIPFFTINQVSVEFIRGLKKLQVSEFVRSVSRPLTISIGAALFINDELSKENIALLIIIGIVVNSLISRITIWNTLRKIPKEKTDFSRKELIKTSLPMMLTGLSATLLAAMPVFFLDYYYSEKHVGIFTVAFRLAGLVSMILVVVNSIAGPKFSELYWSDKKQQLQKLIRQSSLLLLGVTTSIAGVMILGSPWWLDFFGPEFQEGRFALLIMISGQWFNAATGSVGIFMNMSGNQKLLRNVMLFTAIVTCLAYTIVIPEFGINGAAVVSASSAIFSNLTLVILVYKKTGIKTFYWPKIYKFTNNKQE